MKEFVAAATEEQIYVSKNIDWTHFRRVEHCVLKIIWQESSKKFVQFQYLSSIFSCHFSEMKLCKHVDEIAVSSAREIGGTEPSINWLLLLCIARNQPILSEGGKKWLSSFYLAFDSFYVTVLFVWKFKGTYWCNIKEKSQTFWNILYCEQQVGTKGAITHQHCTIKPIMETDPHSCWLQLYRNDEERKKNSLEN